jgi:hypothetical protein
VQHKEQAAVYTPYIKKFAKRIAAIEAVQKALKQGLKCQQAVEAWQNEESYELDFSKFAGQQLYAVQGYVDTFGNIVWEE